MTEPLLLDVFSDLVCPLCYIGKRRLERAVAGLERPVRLVWHAFELDPEARSGGERSAAGALTVRGVDAAAARRMLDEIVVQAVEEGLAYDVERLRSANTFDAHRLCAFALTQGRQNQVVERLMRAHFSEGRAIDDHRTLLALGEEAGLDPTACADLLGGDAHAEEVRADEALAARLGIRGVPFVVAGRRYALSGAQPPEVLLDLFARAAGEAA